MQIDKKLIVMFAEQIFHTGFVHADPHHGNIFVRRMAQGRGSMGSPRAEIVLIDHGLYECINENDRRALCKLWKYIILKDEAKMRHYSKLLNVNGKLLFLFSTRLSYVFDGNDTIRLTRCFYHGKCRRELYGVGYFFDDAAATSARAQQACLQLRLVAHERQRASESDRRGQDVPTVAKRDSQDETRRAERTARQVHAFLRRH